MIHGFAKAKHTIESICAEGEEGIITAYLPDMERFAVSFDGKIPGPRWITFKWTEQEFLKHFDVELSTVDQTEGQ